MCLKTSSAAQDPFLNHDSLLPTHRRRMARTSDGRPAHLRKLQWCLQLTELMQRVHGSRIAHLDLKAANILYRITSSGGLEFCVSAAGGNAHPGIGGRLARLSPSPSAYRQESPGQLLKGGWLAKEKKERMSQC